jgi:DNA-binding NtrC family response regulator
MSNKKTILLVDDDVAILNTLVWYLEPTYDVLTAKDGVDAAYLYEENAQHISALITDDDVPRLDGSALAEWVHHINPELPIIVTSGRIRNGSLKKLAQRQMISLLGKPFQTCQIEKMLNDFIRS